MYIFLACLLTVLIETVFLTLAGLRQKEHTPVIICVNVVSNIALNLLLAVLPVKHGNTELSMFGPLLLFEAAVVLLEYFVYRAAFGSPKRLFLKTFFANLLSFVLGGMILTLLSAHGAF